MNKVKYNAYMRQWRKENPEKAHAIDKRSRIKNSEYFKAYQKEYRLKNRETLLAKKREYNQAHQQEIYAKRREYFKLWGQSLIGKSSKRATKLRQKAPSSLITKDIQEIYENNIKRYGTLTCYLCLKPIEFGQDHLEHKTPINRGGSNTKDNLEIAHNFCNLRKGQRTVEEYKQTTGR